MEDGGRHLPQPAPVEAYGNGGFRFGGLSHRGSLLCFPDGIWAWPIASIADLTLAALEPAFARADAPRSQGRREGVSLLPFAPAKAGAQRTI